MCNYNDVSILSTFSPSGAEHDAIPWLFRSQVNISNDVPCLEYLIAREPDSNAMILHNLDLITGEGLVPDCGSPIHCEGLESR